MTDHVAEVDRESKVNSPPSAPPPHSRWPRVWARVQFVLSLAIAAGVLAYLLGHRETGAEGDDQRAAREESVRLAGTHGIHIEQDCPLCRKIEVSRVQSAKITTPVLTVTGTVAASLRPGSGKGTDYWQFNSSELLTAFSDWQKATNDIAFTETQLTAIKQLSETRVNAQQKLVDRMKKLVEAGTDTEKDLAAAQTELIQAQIQGRKEDHEAETAVRLARKAESALARQIQQAGIDPELLRSMTWDLDIVMADVPEGFVSRVKIGQACEAHFFSFPGQVFSGKVRAIAPVLSKERRSLRVLFAISDPKDQLYPGMFADIGLGTDARTALLIVPEAIVHVGRADYVLVRQPSGDWRVTEVHVGEAHDGHVEVLSGVREGEEVAGRGAILLKPFIIQSLRAQASTAEARP